MWHWYYRAGPVGLVYGGLGLLDIEALDLWPWPFIVAHGDPNFGGSGPWWSLPLSTLTLCSLTLADLTQDDLCFAALDHGGPGLVLAHSSLLLASLAYVCIDSFQLWSMVALEGSIGLALPCGDLCLVALAYGSPVWPMMALALGCNLLAALTLWSVSWLM